MSASTRIASRYAKSLLDLARERGSLAAVTENIRHFQASVRNRDLSLLLASPVVSTSKKQQVLNALFGDYDQLTKAFINIVTDKRREEVLPDIANAYIEQYNKEEGISKLKVTSAAPLNDTAINAIESKLREAGLLTDKVELEQAVDAELLGGFVVEVGDKRFDASAAHQLTTMRKAFVGNPYQKNLR